MTLVLFIQPHLRDPCLHLDPDASYHTGSLGHSASHVAAHAAEGDPAHRHGELRANLLVISQLYLWNKISSKIHPFSIPA